MEKEKVVQIAHEISWKDFSALTESEKTVFLNDSKTGIPFHVLFSQQFNRDILFRLCHVAETARQINKDRIKGRKFLKSLLFGTHALNDFLQPSTRTFLSFITAQQKLGMDVVDIRDINTSSEAKGESITDAIRTFSSYVDLMVMRHPEENAAEQGAWVLNKSDRRIPIINGGSGKDQHPTQALTDIYTLYKSFNSKIDGLTIAMVGDLARGRTVRSLSYLMKNYKDMKLIFVSPPQLQMKDDIKEFLSRNNIFFSETDNLKESIPKADAIYMTRIQDEHDKNKNDSTTNLNFRFEMKDLDLMKKDAVLMHPLPKRDEIDPAIDYCDDSRIVYWRQERNGMWIRMALIATIFRKEQKILDYYKI